LSRRREHLHARALQIRAELSTHIHRETGLQRPTHSFWSFYFEKTKLVCLSVGVCEGGGVRPPPRERVSRAAAEGRRAECVCEAESELESVVRRGRIWINLILDAIVGVNPTTHRATRRGSPHISPARPIYLFPRRCPCPGSVPWAAAGGMAYSIVRLALAKSR